MVERENFMLGAVIAFTAKTTRVAQDVRKAVLGGKGPFVKPKWVCITSTVQLT